MARSQVKLLVGGPVAFLDFPVLYIGALSQGTIQPPTETKIVVTSDSGYRVVFKGDFTVVGGDVIGGTVTSYNIFAGATKVVEGSNYSTSAADLFDALQAQDGHALDDLLFNIRLKVVGSKQDDHAQGSEFSDKMYGRAGSDWLDGWSGNDLIEGGRGNDLIFGDDGNDRLYGGRGSDSLEGGAGDDLIKGGRGNDLIFGDDGNDRLFGGPGNDVFGFRFDPFIAPVGFDKIKDFKVGQDLIKLFVPSKDAPPPGYLGKEYFHKGTEATTDKQVIIYDNKTGRIYYDADGTGPEAQSLFAKVKPGTKLNADDFYVDPLFF